MNHMTVDGYGGHRSRYDDIRLVYELLEDVPATLGLTAAMPPMLLPYYDGVEPDDCGISGFVFLPGGHLTLHTFSFRECYFADLVTPKGFDPERARGALEIGLPAVRVDMDAVTRVGPAATVEHPPEGDYGPHLMVDIDGYAGPSDMDVLFSVFDELPGRIDMTPIMRPYVLRSVTEDSTCVLSVMTMIAETHIALHVFESARRAYLDVFSCRFFEAEPVLATLKETFPGDDHRARLIGRGRGFREEWRQRSIVNPGSKAWLASRPLSPRAPEVEHETHPLPKPLPQRPATGSGS